MNSSPPSSNRHVTTEPFNKDMVTVFSPRMSGWSCLVCCLLLFSTTTVHASLPGSLGLEWGLSLSEFRHMGLDIEEEWSLWNHATAIRLENQTQNLTGGGSLILVFSEELGLIKTHWASKPIERDETGTKGLQLFERQKATILELYGKPQETHEEPSVKLQGFHGNFYQCLQDETCGQWESIWETPEGGLLILELIGLDSGVGFVQRTHQGPNLNDALRLAHPGLDSPELEI